MVAYWHQPPPFCVKLELSEGCNLYCDFCGLRSIRQQREKHYKFMTEETVAVIVDQMREMGWRSRIELSMHGEPTMNPHAADLIRIMRTALPRASIMMTSNGGGLLSGTVSTIHNLFACGLNALALDDYEGAHIVGKIMERIQGADLGGVRVMYYPRDGKEANPNVRRKHNERVLVVIQDIERATKGTHSKVHNTAGLSAPRDRSFNHRRCARPFRELAVRWNGDVALCCNDWRGTYKIGNVVHDGLAAVWQHPRFGAARVLLGNKQRGAIPTCDGCTSTSYREGLIPDVAGKMPIRAPRDEDLAIIAEAEAGAPMAAPVRREWE